MRDDEIQVVDEVTLKASRLAQHARQAGLPMLAYVLDSVVVTAEKSATAARRSAARRATHPYLIAGDSERH